MAEKLKGYSPLRRTPDAAGQTSLRRTVFPEGTRTSLTTGVNGVVPMRDTAISPTVVVEYLRAGAEARKGAR